VICIGSVSIENVSGSANVQFGNIVNRAPITSEKTTNGSGAENEGMLVITSTGFSLTTSIPSTTSPTTTTPTAPSFTPPVITPANPSAPITSSPVE
jgi:Spore germination protein gerPA/gerPF